MATHLTSAIDLAANAIDGNPTSTWQTEHYIDPAFGRLKAGVGLFVSLAKPADLQKLTVTSPTTGWTVEVYAVNGPAPAKLAGWGKPLDRHENIAAGDAVFNLRGQEGERGADLDHPARSGWCGAGRKREGDRCGGNMTLVIGSSCSPSHRSDDG